MPLDILGQSWYSWVCLGECLNEDLLPLGRRLTRSTLNWNDLGDLTGLIQRYPYPDLIEVAFSADHAIPRSLACMDYRRGLFLLPEETGFSECHNRASLLIRSRPSFKHHYRWALSSLDAVVTSTTDLYCAWNRVHYFGLCLYLALVRHKLQTLHPQECSVVSTLLSNHITYLIKDLPHEQIAL